MSTSRTENSIFFLALLLLLGTISYAVYTYMPDPFGIDWQFTYRLASLRALAWPPNPYTIQIFHSPPWTVIPLIPLAILPNRVGWAINCSIYLFTVAFVAHRLGARPMAIAILLTSYPVLFGALYGQIDWLVYLGLILPPRWGLFCFFIKPQDSIGLILFHLSESYRSGLRHLILTWTPVLAALALSVLFYGEWYKTAIVQIGQSWDSSLWPQSIPIGLAILAAAIKNRSAGLALTASPLLAPYVGPTGWGASLMGLALNPPVLLAASAGIWIVRILTAQFLH